MVRSSISRRRFLATTAAAAITPCVTITPCAAPLRADDAAGKARIAITLDLEMSRDYPRRGMLEWDYQKGNLDEATKQYAMEAARIVAGHGGRIHFFCVGRVLEQENIDWLKDLAAAGHPIGNHTYDHVNVLATKTEETQFRFQRSPWLVEGKTAEQVIRENIRLTSIALLERAGVTAAGFRAPGGFAAGLSGSPDVQAMLLELGFKWVSSQYPAHAAGAPKRKPGSEIYAGIVEAQKRAQPFVYPSGLTEIPMSPISDVNAFRANFWQLDWYLEAIRQSVQWAIQSGGVFDFLAHPSCLVVEDPKFQAIELICKLVNEAGDQAELVDLDAIASRVRSPSQ